VRHRPDGDKHLDARAFIEALRAGQGAQGDPPRRGEVLMTLRTGPAGTVRPDEVLRLLGLSNEAVARADVRRTEIRLGE
jgi:hypothetical protein